MSDTYQPIYDAVRSKIGYADIGQAVENAFRDMNLSHYFEQAMYAISGDYTRPSVLYKPNIAQDGDAFIALLGNNIQEGIVGCGDTPEEAMRNFDKAFFEKAVVPAPKERGSK